MSFVDYSKLVAADLSQVVCARRTWVPQTKCHAAEEGGRAAAEEGSSRAPRRRVAAAIDKLRADIGRWALRDSFGGPRRRADGTTRRSPRGTSSDVAGSGDPASASSRRSRRSFVRGEGSRYSGGDASFSSTRSEDDPKDGDEVTASLTSGSSDGGSSASSASTSSSDPDPVPSRSASPTDASDGDGAPASSAHHRPTVVVRRKFRPRHHDASLNRSVEGIMRRPSRYSADVDAVIADAVDSSAAAMKSSAAAIDAAADAGAAPPSPRRRRPSLSRSLPAGNSAAGCGPACSAGRGSSGARSSWTVGSSDRWVPPGVDFSARMEVFVYDRD